MKNPVLVFRFDRAFTEKKAAQSEGLIIDDKWLYKKNWKITRKDYIVWLWKLRNSDS